MSAIEIPQLAVDQLLNRQHDLAQGMVGFWVAGAGPRGPVWHDLTDGRHHGSLTAGLTWSSQTHTGGFGSLVFDGSDDYVDCGVIPFLSRWTISATFVNTAAASSDYKMLLARGGVFTNDTNYALFVRQQNGSRDWGVWCDDSGSDYYAFYRPSDGGAFDVLDGEWHSITASWDGSGFGLYLDGLAVTPTNIVNGVGADGAQNVKLGNGESASDRPWDGNISSVSIHGAAISPAEVRALFNESRQGYPELINRGRRRVFLATVAGPSGHPTMRRWGGVPHMTPGPVTAGRTW